jgi:probable phosphoglycerate mutase
MNQQTLFTNDLPVYRIIFDGGAIGNPGKGYGSYKITGPDFDSGIRELEYSRNGELVTNNAAEYRTLIAALKTLPEFVKRTPGELGVSIFGDSKLVIEQLAGRWKVKSADMKVLHAEARGILDAYGSVKLTWHDRSNSVRELGH